MSRPLRQRFGVGSGAAYSAGIACRPPDDADDAERAAYNDAVARSTATVKRRFRQTVRPLRVFAATECRSDYTTYASLMKLRFGEHVIDFEGGIGFREIEQDYGLDLDLPEGFAVPAGTEIAAEVWNRDSCSAVFFTVSLLCEVLS